MKFSQVILTLSLLLLVVPLLVVESASSSDNHLMSNITRGSSLSLNDTSTPYWLSPSGNLAFGFYRLPCTHSSPNCPDQYVVGIWFVKSPSKTLVWTSNQIDLPLHKPSSIHFTSGGKLMLRKMPDNKEKPLLPDIQEPVLYAMMHDDGNFVLYGSESQILWESFDYATNTILGGQKLRPGVDLFSGDNRLSVKQTDGLVAIYNMDGILYNMAAVYRTEENINIVSYALKGSVSTPITLILDNTGNLCLVGSDGVVLKYLYRNKIQKQEVGTIYRATLDSGGNFNLYKERIDGSAIDDKKSTSNVIRLWSSYETDDIVASLFFIVCVIAIVSGFFFVIRRI